MTIEKEFNEWFEKQLDNGLVDFKLDVRGAAGGTTSEDVMAEILRLEKLIEAGEVYDNPPEQKTKCHPAAEYIICSCIAGMEVDAAHVQNLLKCEKMT